MSPLAENVNVSKMKPKIIFRKAKTSDMEIDKLFALTTKKTTPFFRGLGFKETSKAKLPQKIWQECLGCSRFPADCNEISLIRDI